MAKIDPEVVKRMQSTSCKIVAIQIGNMIGFKGPWLPDHYESFSEALRENAAELARQEQKKLGLNAGWQTPEQEKAFKERKKAQTERQKKAELAAEMANQTK